MIEIMMVIGDGGDNDVDNGGDKDGDNGGNEVAVMVSS